MGETHLAHVPASRLHSKVEFVSLAASEKLAEVEAVGVEGAFRIQVCGGTVSVEEEEGMDVGADVAGSVFDG